MRSFFVLSLAGLTFPIAATAQPFEGFGAGTVGAGSSGYVSLVVTRDDDPDPTVAGTLRHALTQTGPRYVTFSDSLAGKTITLNRRLIIDGASRGQLTLDGSNVVDPNNSAIQGVTIGGYEISIKNTTDVIFKELRIRRGRELMDRSQFRYGNGSAQLDCVSLEDVSNVVLHRISFAWSCDEIVGVVRSQNVTISECIFAEPLGDVAVSPRGTSSAPNDPLPDQIHPYGANHNYCINASASTLSIIRNLFYNYRTRGPQFEANDVSSAYPETGGQRLVKMEAINNVMFNYTESGARYSSSIESGTPANAVFDFQFIGNLFYSHGPNNGTDTGPKEIVAASSSSPSTSNLNIHVSGNVGPHRLSGNPADPNDQRRVVFAKNPTSGDTVQVNNASADYNSQVITTSTTSLSGAPVMAITDTSTFLATILGSAGGYASRRDATDTRIVDTVINEDTSETLKKVVPAATSVPVITSLAGPLHVRTGSTVALIVDARDARRFQWRRNGTDIVGATKATLILDNTTSAHAGSYTAVALNSAGSAESDPIDLTVTGSGIAQLSNLSVRTNLAAGGNLIVGFASEGSKSMLLRAAGPSLATVAPDLTGLMSDPRITLFEGQTQIDSNDNWAAWPVPLAPIFASAGAFPFVDDGLDSALSRDISGSRTMHVRGSEAGIVLVEAYDTGGDGELVNVSARNQVGAGADVLIAGFTIKGDVARTVLIRALGPRLTALGVPGALVNPLLSVHHGDGRLLASNDDWDSSLESLAARTGAAGLPLEMGSHDACLALTLAPGTYTAIVSGVSNSTGEALVEVYVVP